MLIKNVEQNVVNCDRVRIRRIEKWSADIKASVGYARIQRDAKWEQTLRSGRNRSSMMQSNQRN